VVIEQLLGEGTPSAPIARLDLTRMVQLGGRERTQKEYDHLCAEPIDHGLVHFRDQGLHLPAVSRLDAGIGLHAPQDLVGFPRDQLPRHRSEPFCRDVPDHAGDAAALP
jgi:hypothetical protein